MIPREAVLAPGDTLRLSAVVEDANRVPIEGAPVDWLSAKSEVAVVDSGGLVLRDRQWGGEGDGDGGLAHTIGPGEGDRRYHGAQDRRLGGRDAARSDARGRRHGVDLGRGAGREGRADPGLRGQVGDRRRLGRDGRRDRARGGARAGDRPGQHDDHGPIGPDLRDRPHHGGRSRGFGGRDAARSDARGRRHGADLGRGAGRGGRADPGRRGRSGRRATPRSRRSTRPGSCGRSVGAARRSRPGRVR